MPPLDSDLPQKAQPEVKLDQPSVGVTDVMGEFAQSTWRAGVTRPMKGVAQLMGASTIDEPQVAKSGAMRYAEIAGTAVGTLADFAVLGRFVGRGVGAAAESFGVQPLAENTLARSLTISGTTGAIDGFAFTQTRPGEGLGTRFAHGASEAAGFMALDGSTRFLDAKIAGTGIADSFIKTAGRASDAVPSVTTGLGRAGDFLSAQASRAADFGANNLPAWAVEGASATGRVASGLGALARDTVLNKEAMDGMARRAAAGFIGGNVSYNVDSLLTGKNANIKDGESNALGWALGNVLFGKSSLRAPEVSTGSVRDAAPLGSTEQVMAAPATSAEPVVKRGPIFTPEIRTLDTGETEYKYQNYPAEGGSMTYTRGVGNSMNWEIKTPDGQVFDKNTKGPWSIAYPDGSTFDRNEWNYLSFSKPVELELGGKPIQVTETTQLHADHSEVDRTWTYTDPANPDQKVTFKGNRDWEVETTDGKYFNNRSQGPWQVTNLDGFTESRAANSDDIDVQRLDGGSNWFTHKSSIRRAEPTPPAQTIRYDEEGNKIEEARKPRAFRLSREGYEPSLLSEVPRTTPVSVSDDPII